jgi:hypothetical protein
MSTIAAPSSVLGNHAERFHQALAGLIKSGKFDHSNGKLTGPTFIPSAFGSEGVTLECCPGYVSYGFAGMTPQFGSTPNCPSFTLSWDAHVGRCVDVQDDGSILDEDLWRANMTALADIQAMAEAFCDLATAEITAAAITGPEGGCITASMTVQTTYTVC